MREPTVSSDSVFADILPPGTRLSDRYEIESVLGEGGLSRVYLGRHLTIDLKVAIKVLSREVSSEDKTVVRFLREARAASRIAHENVVAVTDFGEMDDGLPFIVMELMDGEILAETVISEAPMPWSRVQPILLQLLAALDAAHGKGVIHRDMKPANCFRLDRMGTPDFIKVFDFGIAKLRDDFTGVTLTRRGAVVGTPDYMAPEQCRGKTVDTRTDLYAVGVIAFEMLTGRVPFTGRRPTEIMQAHVYQEAPPMQDLNDNLDAPQGAEAIVRRAMAKDPSERFQTAREFAQAIIDNGEGLPSVKQGGFFRGLKKMFGR